MPSPVSCQTIADGGACPSFPAELIIVSVPAGGDSYELTTFHELDQGVPADLPLNSHNYRRVVFRMADL